MTDGGAAARMVAVLYASVMLLLSSSMTLSVSPTASFALDGRVAIAGGV